MDYEKKYKEAIELMKDCIPDADGLVHVRPQDIFPELEESEDEKTKRLLHTIANKMSQHLRDIFTEEEFQCFDAWSNAWLKKQGEQKHTPKPKVGDTIYYNSFGEVKSMIVANITTDSTNNPMYEDENGNAVFEEDLIEQKSAWTPMDEQRIENLLAIIEGHGYPGEVAWLNSLKDRVQSKQDEQKSTWSEEDEKMLADACIMLDWYKGNNWWTAQYIKNWLKSLKQRYTWKPSDEQIKVCKEVYADLLSAKGFDVGTINSELNRLEEQLKKLKE